MVFQPYLDFMRFYLVYNQYDKMHIYVYRIIINFKLEIMCIPMADLQTVNNKNQAYVLLSLL